MARRLAHSLLPTPVGPRKSNDARGRCWLPALRHAGVPGLPALASNAFLVAAVPEGFEGHRRGFTERVLWVAELFARLEHRERMGRRQHA